MYVHPHQRTSHQHCASEMQGGRNVTLPYMAPDFCGNHGNRALLPCGSVRLANWLSSWPIAQTSITTTRCRQLESHRRAPQMSRYKLKGTRAATAVTGALPAARENLRVTFITPSAAEYAGNQAQPLTLAKP